MYFLDMPDDPNMPKRLIKARKLYAKWSTMPFPRRENGQFTYGPNDGEEYWKRQETARKACATLGKEARDYVRKYQLSLGCVPRGTGPIRCCECNNFYWDEKDCPDGVNWN